MLHAKRRHGEFTDPLGLMTRGVTGVFRHVPLGNFGDVLAVISALGNGERPARALDDARLDAGAKLLDLGARVVVVELARHRPPGAAEQRGDRITERRLASMTDVQRTGGVCGHEFDHHRRTVAGITGAECGPRSEHLDEASRDRGPLESEIDKPGSRDVRDPDTGTA